jgi:hypothetical protein
MIKQAVFKLQFAVFIAVLYVSLYFLTGKLVGNAVPVALASLLFLPAFARLLGVLVIGLWLIPALFIAGLVSVDLGLGWDGKIVVSAFIATGAPLGIKLASALQRLEPTLSNLTPARLLWLSLAGSFGNMIFYNLSMALVGVGDFNLAIAATTFIGDALGTWAVISVIKLGLTAYGRWGDPR